MGASRESQVNTEWCAELAYAVGLIASDGNLSSDGRHVVFTSKDLENIVNFRICLGVRTRIGMKARASETEKKYFVVQISDVSFYEFLNSIGLTKAKSKTIPKLNIPDVYFRDFLRGCIDGDGNISWSKHPESKHMQLKIRLYSASLPFIVWMKETITEHTTIMGGWIHTDKRGNLHHLCFGKSDSLKIIQFMYYEGVGFYLQRKFNLTK